MRKSILIVLVALVAALIPTFVGTLAAQTYNPTWVKILEVSVPNTPLTNSTGPIAMGVGEIPQLMPSVHNQNNYVGNIIPAFPTVTVSCGAFSNAQQLATALVNGINANGTTVGYTAAVLPPGSRFSVSGPRIPTVYNRGFDVAIFHGEIDPLNFLPLFAQQATEVNNLCDGVLGNELNPSTGLGIDIRLATIATDPQLANFETQSGQVVPANFDWDVGHVSVETAPQSGFPTSGTRFVRMNTAGAIKMFLATGFRYRQSSPFLRFSYRWFNGEGMATATQNDHLFVSLDGWRILTEDTFTPLSAGTRTVEVFIPEVRSYVQDGDVVSLQFLLENGGYNSSNPNDSTVFVDNITFGPAPNGEGNGNYATGAFFKLSTSSWNAAQGLDWESAADKKAHPGGLLTVYIWNSFATPWGASYPFVIMADLLPYGSQPLMSLPGESNIVGLSSTMFPLWSSAWAPGFPPLTFFVPVGLPVDGLYLQVGRIEPNSPNNLLISNLVRHRVE